MIAIETAIVYTLLLWGCWLAAQCLCEFVETTVGASPVEKPLGSDIARRTGASAGEVP